MKLHLLFFCLVTTSLIFGQQSFMPINKNASPEAKELLTSFYEIRGENIISGHHNYSHHMDKSPT